MTAAALDHPRLKILRDRAPGTLVVHELYRSLQGEGTYSGLPCAFVRLSACHLRCGYCDTPHAFHQGETFTVENVFKRAIELGDDLVEITGGEPLLQAEVHPLMARLADAGRTVLLETSGALDISGVDSRVHIILDLKTPGSGEVEANHWPNLGLLKPTDEVKIVVCGRADFDWAIARIDEHDLTRRVPVLMAAAHGRVDLADLAAWILAARRPIRLQDQLHKRIWGADSRGV